MLRRKPKPRGRPPVPKTDRQQFQKKCDQLWAQLIKERAEGNCEVCGRVGHDAHHMVMRNKSRFLRHRMENGMFLCKSCHFRFHNQESLTCWKTLEENRPEDFAFLKENMGTKNWFRYEEVYGMLNGLRKQ